MLPSVVPCWLDTSICDSDLKQRDSRNVVENIVDCGTHVFPTRLACATFVLLCPLQERLKGSLVGGVPGRKSWKPFLDVVLQVSYFKSLLVGRKGFIWSWTILLFPGWIKTNMKPFGPISDHNPQFPIWLDIRSYSNRTKPHGSGSFPKPILS